MRLSVWHTSIYRFSRPVLFNPHRLMLRPRAEIDLDILSYCLEVTPESSLAWSSDVFGNTIATATFSQSAVNLVVDSRMVVEVRSAEWPVYAIAPRAQQHPFRYSIDEAADLGVLLTPEGDGGRVAEWAAGFVAGPPTDTLSLLKDVNTGVGAQIVYEPRCEEDTQTAGETLRRGRERAVTSLSCS